MTVNGGTVNVPVEAEEVPALGTVSITTAEAGEPWQIYRH